MSGEVRENLAYSIRPGQAITSSPSSAHRRGRTLLVGAGLALFLLTFAGCGSIHAGWPGVPISVGLPLGGLAKPRPFTVALTVESEPPGADVTLDGRLVGTTPTVVHLVFTRSFTGSCHATPVYRLLLVKAGYRPEGLSYTCQLAWDLSEGPAADRRLAARLRLEPEW